MDIGFLNHLTDFQINERGILMKKPLDLISYYIDICMQWGYSGTAGKANKIYDKIRSTERKLKETEEGTQQLISILSHSDGYVRLNAASTLLNIVPREAEKCLEELSKERGTLGFISEITLQEWRKGTLKIQ